MSKYIKIFIPVLFFLIGSGFAQQKIVYVDSKVIIDNMQDAKDAQKTLDGFVTQWKSEISTLNDSLNQIKDDYEKKKLILTENIRKQKEQEITSLGKRIEEYKTEKFGEGGEYFRKQDELMKPVQDKVFKAIADVAKEGDYDFVFDRSTEMLLLYMNEKFDLTPQVMKKLEIK